MVLLFVVFAVTAWGWSEWIRSNRAWTVSSVLAIIGFALTTSSVFLAIGALIYGAHAGGFRYGDPHLLSIYGWGFLISLTAFALSLGGLFRPNPLRWFAAPCSVGALLFWAACALSER